MFFRSPGYAVSLVAESSTSAIHCAEAVSRPGVAPEDIGLQASRALLAEISKGGCIDRKHQTLVLLMMVLGSEDVGRCRMGEPTPRTYVNYSLHMRDSPKPPSSESNSYETFEASLEPPSKLLLLI